MTDRLGGVYDVVVVGGGAAGLNGALMLARARREVVVVDAGAPRNAPAAGVHGPLGHDGVPPAELLARGRSEVRAHGGRVVTGVLATGPMSVHQALLFRQWSTDVTFLTHTGPAPTDEQAEQLAARGVPVVPGEVVGLEVAGDRLAGVRLADGTLVEREVLAVAPRMVARAGFLTGLGLRPVPHPSGAGEHLPADPTGRSEVPGVWLAGNVTDLMAQVGGAAAGGAFAAAQLNADLVAEDTRRAVGVRRAVAAAGRGPVPVSAR